MLLLIVNPPARGAAAEEEAVTHPVAVKDDDGVGCSQVDSQTACSGAQQEQKHLGVVGELRHLQEERSRSARRLRDQRAIGLHARGE